ncbi:hypothetical protein STIAU_8357 [Stigmatella aurantiaca DW4/3-1]|uniref:Uncharacterized protein n=1 Tax=Stigmatella aurantiaca (strain DW4/3-1) TaxID=378806 RepID=Q09E85_STIAD|nr:hypothetical protein STIAU_8357 [Stigmatella aurantiaca DW4/3-1]
MLAQPHCPAPERGRPRPQREGGPSRRGFDPLERYLQILQQDSPGDTVHDEVVNDEQEQGGLSRAAIEQRGAEQWALLQREARLSLGGEFLEAGLLRRACEGREIQMVERYLAIPGRLHLDPPPLLLVEAHA